jgi:hypothetical protein
MVIQPFGLVYLTWFYEACKPDCDTWDLLFTNKLNCEQYHVTTPVIKCALQRKAEVPITDAILPCGDYIIDVYCPGDPYAGAVLLFTKHIRFLCNECD